MNVSTATEKLARYFGLNESDEMDFETAEIRNNQDSVNKAVKENSVNEKTTASTNGMSRLNFNKKNVKTDTNQKMTDKNTTVKQPTYQKSTQVENERVKPQLKSTGRETSQRRQTRMEESLVNKIAILEPRTYTESKEIAKCIFRNEIVIVNFHLVDESQARRIVDFLTGAVYALDGDIQRLGGELFICTPPNTEIDSATAKSLLETQFNA